MRCNRCAGLVVAEQFIGGASPNGGWAYGGWRCVNCGAIDFPVRTGALPVLRSEAGNRNNGLERNAPTTKVRRHEQRSDHR